MVNPKDGVQVKPEPLPFGMADCPPEVIELTKDQFYEGSASRDDQKGDPSSFFEEVVFLSTTDDSSVSNLPHGRTECLRYPFTREGSMTAARQKSGNKRFCPSCYCLVCEVPAKDCLKWLKGDMPHCNADLILGTRTGYWKKQKQLFSNSLFYVP